MSKIGRSSHGSAHWFLAVIFLCLWGQALGWSSAAQASDVTYEYDAQGRLKKATFDAGTVVDYSYDSAGNRIAAAITSSADSVAPSVPASLSATPVSAARVDLAWTASTDNVAVSGYAVQRCAGSTCTSFTQIATPATTGYSDDTGLAGSTTYRYRVSARDAAGNVSGFSNIASASTPAIDSSPPGAPGVPTFSNLTGNSVVARWTAATDNVAVTAYEYQHNAGPWVSVGNVLSIQLVGLESGLPQTFRVRARDAAGNLGAASAGTFTPPDTAAPSVPGAVTVTSPSSSTVNITWAPSSDNVGVSGYRITRNGSVLTSVTAMSYTDTAVSGSTRYAYTIAAYDAAGNTSSASTEVAVTTPDTLAPTTPGSLNATAVSFTQVNVSWGAATDAGGSGLAGYRLYRNSQLIMTTTATSFSDTGLTQGTTYSYTIAAYDNAGNESVRSSAVEILTPAPLGVSMNATTWDYSAQVGQPTSISPNVVVTARGGSGGYTYAWQRVSGDTQTTVNSATSNSTGWFRTIPSFHVYYTSVWRCEVRDSSGTIVYTPNVTVTFIKENLD